jgi:hypothetical protein
METEDKKIWTEFRSSKSSRVTHDEVLMIAELHAKYYQHRLKVPCSCSPRQLQGYIDDLNKVYES